MLKKMLMVMGIVLTGMVGSCVFMLGNVGLEAANEAKKNHVVAAAVIRDLSQAWDANALRPHFSSAAIRQVDFRQAQQSMNQLKALGALTRVEQAQQTEYQFHTSFGGTKTKNATIVMVAEFENGRATVTIKLMNDGDEMKLQHVNVATIGEIRVKMQKA